MVEEVFKSKILIKIINNKIEKEGDNIKTVSSREISRLTNIRHDHLIRDIEKIITKTKLKHLFIKSRYEHSQNKQLYKEYLLTKEGLALYIDNKRKTPQLKELINTYKDFLEYDKVPIVLTTRFEDSFIKQLEETLKPMKLSIIKQYNYKEYKIDAVIKELNLAIEYDEEQHFTRANRLKDKLRQEVIEKEFEVIRVNYKNSDACNVGIVMKYIFENLNKKIA